MGAACGKNTKRKNNRQKPYVDLQTDPNHDTRPKETNPLPSDRVLNPAQSIGNDPQSPHNYPPNVRRDGHETYDVIVSRNIDDGLKYSFNNNTYKEGEYGDNLKGSKLNKGTLTSLDQPQKGQMRPVMNDPVEKPRSLVMVNSNQGYKPNQPFDYRSSIQVQAENMYDPFYEEVRRENEELYMDMNENALKDYENFLLNARQNSVKVPRQQSVGGNRGQSNLLDWSQLIQKQLNQEKSTMNVTDNRNKLQKAYRALVIQDERSWYEEMVNLYKEQQVMFKTTGLTLDRKIIQLQEQFKWFVSAVANTRLNPNITVGVHEFPPFRMASRRKDKLDTSVISMAKGQSVTGSDEQSDIFSPMRSQGMQFNLSGLGRSQIGGNNNGNQIGGGLPFSEGVSNPYQKYYADLPEIFAPAWQQGFVWKGVYLKMYTKREAISLKKELKVLKHMGIEYLQTETAAKMTEIMPSLHFNPNESMETGKYLQGQTLNALMPLLCLVESSSWVLLGTPILPTKKSIPEDYITKLSNEVQNMFKKTPLLSNTNMRNFKVYYKPEENQQQPMTFGNLNSRDSQAQNNGNFLILSNVGRTMAPLPKVNTMMIIGQEINSAISFLEYPSRGIESNLIKKALGYADEEIGVDALFPNKRESKTYNDLRLEVLKFRRNGWDMRMIYVTSNSRILPPTFAMNRRAMDLLTLSETKSTIEIRGNVIVFGCLENSETIVHPYFITEASLNSSFVEDNLGYGAGSFVGKESFLKGSFAGNNNNKYDKVPRDERIAQEFFLSNLGRSIDSIIDQLENTDYISNFAGLKELFHRRGVNMRFEWIVWIRLRNPKARVLVGADILARCVKRMLNEKTSKRLSSFKKQAINQRKRLDELLQDKSDFFLEDYFKKILCQYVNMLMRDYTELQELEKEEDVFGEINTDLFLHRTRVIDVAKKFLDVKTLDLYLSAETLKNIVNIPCLHANTFLDAISYHTHICVNYEILRQVRNDKYINWLTNQGILVKHTDVNILYTNESYLSINERCYALLLKLPLKSMPSDPQNSIELTLPASLYKMRTRGFQTVMKDYYELPNLEIINDWIVLLESVLSGLYTPDGQQGLLIEAYILQMVLAYFGEGENDNRISLSILEKINNIVNNSPVTSPELTVTINTWCGILSETKMFVDCEQSYAIALLVLHKMYGDPRGRGGQGTPWELFVSWRLSILCRLQGKIHDAEYSEELYDATLLTLKDNPMNSHLKSHFIYNDPFKDLRAPSPFDVGSQNELSHLVNKPSLKNMSLKDHPFPYWANHLAYDETSSKIDALNETLIKTPQLLKWIITYMPTFQPTGILWDTAYLKDFFLSIMQNSFSNTTSVSSVSNNSINRDRSIIGGLDMSQGIRSSSSGTRYDKKEKKFNPGGNLVQIFEKDASTFNKREINGTVYSWGQNDKGQVGAMLGNIEDLGISGKKKTRIYYPKRIITLKDTVIVSVACGHSHSMAITLNGLLLAWGDNKSCQLGLGPKTPQEVYVPTLVSGIKDVVSASCGHEHSVALTKAGYVYSWGNGEDGLLGHGDIYTQSQPKRVEALRNCEIQSVVCGGLHTLALTKDGSIYTWGKGEGGQLGLPLDQLTQITSENRLYLATPKKIRTNFNGQVIQIVCGDAHSLALTQKGLVYGWGYTYSGQLGLGFTSDSPGSNQTLQILEPTLIEKIANVKITDIFAGATFSLFLSDRKELYACGLNESNQLGIEKNVTKINTQLDRFGPASALRATESAIPTKLDCFTSMPVLQVACGEAHSVALSLCDSSYILFSWGMQKQGQLGLGDMQIPSSTPRPISFLQYVMAYSMACGAYHTMVVLGEPSKTFKNDALYGRLEKSPEKGWSSIFFELRGSYDLMIEAALNNLDNIIPSEEGKIDNPKAIKKGSQM